jgi:hypothetical protein
MLNVVFAAGLIVIAAAIVGMSISGRIPLTYDESFNYHDVSRLGAVYSLTSYKFPNNHIFFSALQSLLPDRLILDWPPLVRLLNVLYGIVLLLVVCHVLRTHGGLRSGLFGAAVIALCSPLFTLYFFVARGYLLGTLLLLLSLVTAATGRKHIATGIFAGLATACVPTFALALPGVFAATAIAVFAEAGARRALLAASSVAGVHFVIAGAVYIPIRNLVLGHRNTWMAGVRIPEYFAEVLSGFANHLVISILLVVAITVQSALVLKAWRQGIGEPGSVERLHRRALTLGLIASCVSYYLLICLLYLFKFSNVPFVRNGMFSPAVLWLALLLLRKEMPRSIERATVGLAAANSLVGIIALARAFSPGMDPNQYPWFTIQGPTPAHAVYQLRRAGASIDALEAAEGAQMATIFYSDSLGVPLRELKDAATETRCAAGRSTPPASQSVIAISSGRRLLLCY